MPPLKRFSKDVKWMTGRKPNLYWQITWRFVGPLLLLIVFVAFVTLRIQKPPSYAAWNPKYVRCCIFSKLLLKARVCIFFSPSRSFKIIAIYCLPTKCSLKWCSAQKERAPVHTEVTRLHLVKRFPI